jgi:translocation and assembly module TamA
MLMAFATAARSAERTAAVVGVEDRALREAIERAVGEEQGPAASRNEARRRARAAAQNAEALLRSEGYYASTIVPEIGEGDQPQAQVKIDPGPRFKLAAPAIEWIGPAPDAQTSEAAGGVLALTPGGPGRAADVIAAEGRASAILQARGYADAKIEPRNVIVDHADHSVKPTFKYSAGNLVRLDGLRIEGKSRTRPDWVSYLTPWKAGAVYRPDSVAELERRLLDTQVYDSVTVALSPEPTKDGLRPVVVNLVDRPRRLLEVGAGYSTAEGADVDFRWSLFNRLRRGDTVTAEARYANIDSRLGLDVLLPHWRKPGRNLKLTGELFHQDTDAYIQTGAAIKADLTHRFGARTSYFTRGVSFVAAEVNDKHTGLVKIGVISALAALALDRSDDPLNPRRGFKTDFRLEPTAIVGDENLVYLKAQAQASTYFAFGTHDDTVIAVRGRIGSILGGRIPQVPAAYRFFAGGGGSVRGYEYQGVGPRYADNTPQGGLSLIEASLELRRPLFGKFGGVAFLDAGSVARKMAPDFSNLSLAAGVGVRYDLGFAPIRFDIAVPMDQPKGALPFQIYISIGQSF